MIGFVSKWDIGNAAVAEASPFAYAGLVALILAALLAAAYILEIVVRAWMPREAEKTTDTVPGGETSPQETSVQEFLPVGWRMRLPLVLMAIAIVVGGIFSVPILRFLADVAMGIR